MLGQNYILTQALSTFCQPHYNQQIQPHYKKNTQKKKNTRSFNYNVTNIWLFFFCNTPCTPWPVIITLALCTIKYGRLCPLRKFCLYTTTYKIWMILLQKTLCKSESVYNWVLDTKSYVHLQSYVIHIQHTYYPWVFDHIYTDMYKTVCWVGQSLCQVAPPYLHRRLPWRQIK